MAKGNVLYMAMYFEAPEGVDDADLPHRTPFGDPCTPLDMTVPDDIAIRHLNNPPRGYEESSYVLQWMRTYDNQVHVSHVSLLSGTGAAMLGLFERVGLQLWMMGFSRMVFRPRSFRTSASRQWPEHGYTISTAVVGLHTRFRELMAFVKQVFEEVSTMDNSSLSSAMYGQDMAGLGLHMSSDDGREHGVLQLFNIQYDKMVIYNRTLNLVVQEFRHGVDVTPSS